MLQSAVAMLDSSVQHPPIHNFVSVYETDNLKMKAALHEDQDNKMLIFLKTFLVQFYIILHNLNV